MCIVGTEGLEGGDGQDVLLESASTSRSFGARRRLTILPLWVPTIYLELSICFATGHGSRPGSMCRTILSLATMNVLVASPFLYTGPRLAVKREYLSFGSSSGSSSESSSSESCSTLGSPLLAVRWRRASSWVVALASSSFDAAAMADAWAAEGVVGACRAPAWLTCEARWCSSGRPTPNDVAPSRLDSESRARRFSFCKD